MIIYELANTQQKKGLHSHSYQAASLYGRGSFLKMDRKQQGGLSYGKEKISKGNNADSVGGIRHESEFKLR